MRGAVLILEEGLMQSLLPLYLHVAVDSLSCPCFPAVGYRCATPPLGDELKVQPRPFIRARQAHCQLQCVSCPHFVSETGSHVAQAPSNLQPTRDNLQLLIPPSHLQSPGIIGTCHQVWLIQCWGWNPVFMRVY